MPVILRTLRTLPPPASYTRWVAIGVEPSGLAAERQLADVPRRLEEAFDASAEEWLELGSQMGRDSTSHLAHTPSCAANLSDFGLMLAWSRLVGYLGRSGEPVLAVCDDPWLFRHLGALDGVQSGPAPRLFPYWLRLTARGVAARLFRALACAAAALRLRHQRDAFARGGRTLLVYGHPGARADGTDGYFGDLMLRMNGLERVLHVDCPPARARSLAAEQRAASLHAWGSPAYALSLVGRVWRPSHALRNSGPKWLVRRAATLEASGAQGAAVAWQSHCQRRWISRCRPRVVAWPWENHGWERDLVRAARAASVRTVGYQHSVVGTQMLNYSPRSNSDGHHSLPDRILCTGAATCEQLASWGMPPDRLAVGGAFRMPRIERYTPSPEGMVYLALPFDFVVAREMIEAARPLAANGRRFVAKPHPMTPYEFAASPGLTATDKPFYEIAELAAVVYAATTVGLEAALAGIPTIRFRPAAQIALNILPKDVALPATDAKGLEEALRRCINPRPLVRDSIFASPAFEVWRKEMCHS